MFGLIVLIMFGAWALFQRQSISETANDLPSKISEKLDALWGIAQESLQDKKYLRAEKALLTILRFDEKNATAYNRLGILYAKQKAFKDAIECFEIAQSLEPNASSLHNVGLIYYETENYPKAALAFEQALEMDDMHASRHIAYAKVQEKLGNVKKMVKSLEKAIELDPTPQTLNILADAYDKSGETELATDLREKAASMLISASGANKKRPRQPRQVI